MTTTNPNADAETAMQYLIWALEALEKAGSQEAVHHTRIALEALRKSSASIRSED
ncbi:hypothetical protein N2603_32390 [Bradyrhizobium huanghuaihaiense]|uniref:hypothetical protein n=1 Tax=Bradyrhizobium huanghuaihaiense TaxID=990078 RepID=UPI0021AA62D1|nr:hypothetical protein [Bradyrhizobium sp. CB3035]UWU74719.1 hypothetical protein N2603_32390 [Bradyrhizobium sp. CB3035]